MFKIFNSLAVQKQAKDVIFLRVRHFADFDRFAKTGDKSNVLANQHIKYMPKRRLSYDYVSGDGPLHLLFEGSNASTFRPHTWKVTLATALPAYYYGAVLLAANPYSFLFPLVFTPTLYYLRDARKAAKEFQDQVQNIWMMKNGEQLVLKTYDGTMHKVNIAQNGKYSITPQKNNELVFVMQNNGRSYTFSNKDASYFDYDIIDRIIHQIPIDTKKHQALYHNLIYKQVPQNLRPSIYNVHIPQYYSHNVNTSKFIWKCLNRVIYREGHPQWLRRNMQQPEADLTAEDEQVIKTLQKEHGLRYVHDGDLFYQLYKISRKDFLDKLQTTKDQNKRDQIILDTFYGVEGSQDIPLGRRGVLSLQDGLAQVKSKIRARKRLDQFAQKFNMGDTLGMSNKQFRQQGGANSFF